MRLRNERASAQSNPPVEGTSEVAMNKIRTAALVAALVVTSASSFGQEKKDAPPAAPPAAAQAPPASPPRESPPPPPSAGEPQRGVVKDDEFIPTQDIPPDEGVTF